MATTTTRIEDATTAAADAMNATTDAVNRATDRVREEFGTNERRIRELVDEYPISCFIGAVVTGYLLGRIATRV
jgi:hypothetical protein